MFKLIKIEGARINVPEPELLKAGEAIKAGEALALSGGALVAATTAATHVALAGGSIGTVIPAARIDAHQIYEVPFKGTPSAVAGDALSLAEGALSVSAASDGNGVLTLVSQNGATADGDTVIVRFVGGK